MVISLSHDTAFAKLEDDGYVVTFRSNQRKNRFTETWCNRGRGTEKEFDVHVAEICEIRDSIGLEEFVEAAGFRTKRDWEVAIMELNDGELPSTGYLYLVTRIDQ